MSVCVCMQTTYRSRMWHKCKIYEKFKLFEFIFSFAKTSYHTKIKELRLHYHLNIAGGLRVITLCENSRSSDQDLNSIYHLYFLLRRPLHHERLKYTRLFSLTTKKQLLIF